MIVYGDAGASMSLLSGWRLLVDLAARLRAEDAEAWRELLVLAGQVEQAAHDTLDPQGDGSAPHFVAASRALTRCAARGALACWLASHPRAHAARTPSAVTCARELAASIARTGEPPPLGCTMKTPEGFAFYALFPEQYCAAAWKWITERAEVPERVAVIGVRSIGTSLAALVGAVLESVGVAVSCFTVRPTGHPFDRRVRLERRWLGGARTALIVDEGPGLSGSSFASVARALRALDVSDLTFFPSHGGEPGRAASPEVRALWAGVPAYHVPWTSPIFGGVSLPEALARALGPSARVAPDGDWRGEPATWWSPRCARFATPRLRLSTGAGLVACKFAGLAHSGLEQRARLATERLHARADAGLGPEPLPPRLGFTVAPWIEARCVAPPATDPVLAALADSLAATAGPPLTPQSLEAAQARRRAWTTHNLAELDAHLATRAERALEENPLPPPWTRRTTEYDLGPGQWLAGARIVKVGAVLGDLDHTAAGVQPLPWSVATAVVEWRMSASSWARFQRELLRAFGAPLTDELVRPFVLAYVALRLGMYVMCREDEPRERERMDTALADLRARLDVWALGGPALREPA